MLFVLDVADQGEVIRELGLVERPRARIADRDRLLDVAELVERQVQRVRDPRVGLRGPESCRIRREETGRRSSS